MKFDMNGIRYTVFITLFVAVLGILAMLIISGTVWCVMALFG